ncbi:hypothetical protein GCM10009552_26210 [Rothia nasimurium]
MTTPIAEYVFQDKRSRRRSRVDAENARGAHAHLPGASALHPNYLVNKIIQCGPGPCPDPDHQTCGLGPSAPARREHPCIARGARTEPLIVLADNPLPAGGHVSLSERFKSFQIEIMKVSLPCQLAAQQGGS